MSRGECRNGNATRSRLPTGITGTCSACAITFAVVTPTRSPVNNPGPMHTAIAARCESSVPVSSATYRMAGTSCSA